IASFNFFTSNGVTPFVAHPLDGLFQYDRWTPMVQGDFDGDGAPDYAFYATDSKGQSVIASLLSREHYAQVHTLPVGNIKFDQFTQLELVPVSSAPGALPWLAVHRQGQNGPNGSSANDVILYAPQPASAAQLAAGAPATSFALESTFHLFDVVGIGAS